MDLLSDAGFGYLEILVIFFVFLTNYSMGDYGLLFHYQIGLITLGRFQTISPMGLSHINGLESPHYDTVMTT